MTRHIVMSDCANLHSPSSCTDTPFDQDTVVGFLPEPNCGRGTAGIIWNCLAVMVFSAWTIIHLDTKPLPSSLWCKPFLQRVTNLYWKPWRRVFGYYRDGCNPTAFPGYFGRKSLEALVVILFPEFGVLVAIEEFSIAQLIQSTTRCVDGWEAFTLRQAHLIQMGGIDLPQIERPEDFAQFVAQNVSLLDYSLFPSEDQIALRAKKDYMDKAVALVQVVYFISNLSVRAAQSYRLAVLEMLTLNYIIYATVMFLLRLKKPQELQEAFELDVANFPSTSASAVPDNYEGTRHRKFERWTWWCMVVSIISVNIFSFTISPWSMSRNSNGFEPIFTLLCGLGVVAILMFMTKARFEDDHGQWYEKSFAKKFCWYTNVLVMYIGGFLYVSTRIYILTRAFQIFNVAPAGIYATPSSWTSYIGHIGA
ncbi:hypothetical protein BU25DRAFT_410631 [Macroventuria anomochaeta]|uniref:Uncharacterized protein n=1 Tax=Macroventuria anomochaeta TaxID=301207 RepID=A0ACB6S198_9PLEO|nr:uncharacterized protein BU25DRAFT_410631 [Macroventuria anomochaeta]KAF2628005.1 hypothetical protein BU25DRAFT_410631 [Macroventuria anomochaeta]